MTRIDKLRELLGGDFSAALIEHDANRWYLSEFRSSAGTLVITPDDALFIADFRYIEAAEKNVAGARVVLQKKLSEQLREYFAEKGITEVSVEDEMPLGRLRALKSAVPGVEFSPREELSKAVGELRSAKEPKEIEAIKAAQAITDAAFSYILGFIEPGRTEREIAAELEYYMRRNGADGTAFDTIALGGPNGSMPHGVPSDRKLAAGDFVTMDFGAKKDGYCSDMTRTVAVRFADEEMKNVYETVLSAHMAARTKARAGISGRDLDKTARDIIYAAGYEGKFGHGLGHSLGLEIHETPSASPLYERELGESVIMTIEPGVYLPGRFGVRIENMVVLGENGNENLTRSPVELIVL